MLKWAEIPRSSFCPPFSRMHSPVRLSRAALTFQDLKIVLGNVWVLASHPTYVWWGLSLLYLGKCLLFQELDAFCEQLFPTPPCNRKSIFAEEMQQVGLFCSLQEPDGCLWKPTAVLLSQDCRWFSCTREGFYINGLPETTATSAGWGMEVVLANWINPILWISWGGATSEEENSCHKLTWNNVGTLLTFCALQIGHKLHSISLLNTHWGHYEKNR